MKLLDQIRGKQNERREAVHGTYADAVRAAATDAKGFTPDDVESALQTAGKTIDDLTEDVALYQQRQSHIDDIDRVEELQKQIAQEQAKLHAAKRRRDEAFQKANLEVAALEQKTSELSRSRVKLGNPEQKLRESAPSWIEERRQALVEERVQLEEQADYARFRNDQDGVPIEERERHEKTLKTVDKRLAEARDEIRELESKQVEVWPVP